MRFLPSATPNFCIIAPTAYLDRYASQTKTHLVLAHLIDHDPAYTAYYKERSQAGDTIICDNGAFEMGVPYDPDRLVELGKRVGAHALVLPDYPFDDFNITIDAARKWIPYFKEAGFSTFFVPQSVRGDLDGWLRSYEWAAGNPDIDIIGMSILGIPNALPHIPTAYARVVMSQLILSKGIKASKYHHYLGLNSGPALEIPALIKMGMLNSCDSSNPVWMAILGHEYTYNTDSYLPVSKVKKEVEFDYPMTRDQATLRRIQTNVDMTLELFK